MKKNVVIVDIDGVLADYRLGLLYWIRQSCPELSQKANAHLKVSNTWIDAKSMDVSYRRWLEVLEMFRMSGGKQTIPTVQGAGEFLSICEARGWEIVLLTSRPIDIYSNIYRDTLEWLRNNQLQHHLLLWSKSKAEIVFKMRLIDKIVFAVDDEIKHIEDYAQLKVPTYWIDLYDTQREVPEGCTRFNNLMEVIKHVELEHVKQT